MQDEFLTGAKVDPQHHVLIQNVEKARAWFQQRGPERGLPLALTARHDFQLLERTVQPTLPGPLPDDFADFESSPVPSAADRRPERFDPSAVTPEGHERIALPPSVRSHSGTGAVRKRLPTAQ